MKKERKRTTRRLLVVCAIGAVLAGAALAVAGPSSRTTVPPALLDASVPRMPQDLGIGERLVLVVGGVYDSQAEAIDANETLGFGDLQGYYVVPTSQFDGLEAALPSPGAWVLATAFRTKRGAAEFVELARAAGAPAFVTPRVQSLGGWFTGLGQEEAPDGMGPLTHAIPASEPR